jgi:hypothetical protein
MNNEEVPEDFFFIRGNDASVYGAVLTRTSIRISLLVKCKSLELTAFAGRALTIEAQVVGTTKLMLMSTLPQAIIDTCLHTYLLGQMIPWLPQ